MVFIPSKDHMRTDCTKVTVAYAFIPINSFQMMDYTNTSDGGGQYWLFIVEQCVRANFHSNALSQVPQHLVSSSSMDPQYEYPPLHKRKYQCRAGSSQYVLHLTVPCRSHHRWTQQGCVHRR